MIHYHGGPCSSTAGAVALWSGRHACVSFADPKQTALAFEVCQSVMLDNGAFTHWKKGGEVDVDAYASWVAQYERHPAFDWCLVPDAIDGDEQENDALIAQWSNTRVARGLSVPVWHMHESLERLTRLVDSYPRIALGSSGMYATVGTVSWWERMAAAMAVCCDKHGRPLTRLHGLRMLSPTVFSHIPLASADSTNVARNATIDARWTGAYPPVSAATRALVLAERIESHVAAARFNADAWGSQCNLELIG
jgi:hypothetical protein